MKDWNLCQRCHLCRTRAKVVFVRGTLPCDTLFVGEAPGPDENAIGYPFVGRAGKLADAIRVEAFAPFPDTTFAYVNALGCLPTDDDDDGHFRPPTLAELACCQPRLQSLIAIAEPRAIVALGKVAAKTLATFERAEEPFHLLQLQHPSYILRKGGKTSPEYRRSVLDLRTFIASM